ncbi:MAG: RICIN domain-containing protein, partial [Clostridia bacterium]|nr:RICIN domain-containing protein [Clostridia bacterium]
MFKKLLVCVLSLALIISIIPLNVSAETSPNTNYFRNSDYGDIIQSESEAEILYEITEKRDVNTKHFAMSDGTIKACVYPEDVHYKKDGKYLDINNTLVEIVVDGKTYHQNTANSFKAKFPQNSQDFIEFSNENGYVKFRLVGALNKSVEKVQEKLEITSLKEDKTIVKNNNSRAIYKSVKADIDIEYDVTGNMLKETIVLGKKKKQSYTFEILTSAVSAVKNDDNSISFYDNNTKEICTIASPYMVDAANEYSNDITTTLVKNSTGYTLTYTPDYGWLSNKQRVYPVKIDPSFVKPVGKEDVIDTFVYTNQNTANERGGYDVINVGKRTSGLITRGFVKFDLPSEISDNDSIVDASLYLTHYDNNSTVSGTQIDVHALTNNFTEFGTFWDNQPSHSSIITDYTFVKTSGFSFTDTNNNVYTYDRYNLTTLVGNWHRDPRTNHGIMLKLHDENETLTSNKQVFYHSKDSLYFSAVSKFVEITYRNTTGLENYWSYFTKDLGQYGTGSVNNYNGNLVYTHNDVSFSSLINGVTLSHVYNSNLSLNGVGRYGNGWGLNLVQTLKPKTIESNSAVKYVYTDGDGTEHFFIQTEDNSIKDEDGLGLTYTNNISVDPDLPHKLTDKDNNVYLFDTKGYLRKITDTNSNVINLNYTSTSSTDGYLSSVTTSSGCNITLNYSNGKLVSVTDNAGRTTNFTIDTSGNLTKITYPDNSYVTFTYSSNKLNVVTTPSGQKLSYNYLNGRVSSAKTIGNQGTTLDNYIFEYDNRQTVVTEMKPNGDVKNKYTYQFDSYGRVICVYDKNQNVYSQSYTEKSTASNSVFKNNKISTESNGSTYVNNLIVDPTFSNGNENWVHYITGSTATRSVVTGHSLISTNSILLTSDELGFSSIHQFPNSVAGKTYTLSAYIKLVDVEGVYGAGVEIVTSSNTRACNFKTGTTDTSVDNGFEKITATITLGEGETINRIGVGLFDAKGSVYVDSVQLEDGETDNPINLISNSSFEKNDGNDTLPHYYTTDCGPSVGGCKNTVKHPNGENYTMQIIGNIHLNASIYQTVSVSGKAGDVYSFGGWAKADSLPQHWTTGYVSCFEMSIRIFYTDGTEEWVSNPFNIYINDWQFSQKTVPLKKSYNRIDLYFGYNHNCNSAYFDNLFLYRDTMQSYTYDSNGNVISTEDYTNQNSSYNYTNNNLSRMISPTGSGYEYSYDTKNLVVSSKNSEGLQYNFTYDNFGNPTDTILSSNNYSSSIESGKTYYIRLKSAGKYLTVENASTANDANVIVSEFTGNANQRWKIEKLTDGMFYLYPQHATNMVLEVTNGLNVNPTNVAISTNVNADKQKWTIVPQSDYTYNLYPKTSPDKKVLTVNYSSLYNNVTIISMQNLNNADQEWYFEPIENNTVNSLEDGGIYQFKGHKSGKYIDCNNTISNPSTTIAQNYMSLGESQRYLVKKYGSTDYYTLAPISNTEKLIEVSTSTHSDGNVYLVLGNSTVTDRKLFKFEYNSSKQGFVIVPKYDETLALTSVDGSSNPNKAYILSAKSTDSAFIFIPEKFSETINSTATYQDNGNFPHTITDSRGNTTTYGYDYKRGLQTSVTDANGTTTEYSFNQNNDRLESVVSSGKTVNYLYNTDGTLKKITSPSGTQYNFGYDQFGRNTNISVGNSLLSSTEYFVNDPSLVSKFTYGNGVSKSYSYDELQRLTSESVNNTVIRNYVYDKHNNIAEINDLAAGYNTTYSYDLIGRITGIKLGNGQSLNYLYDKFNRISLWKWSLGDIALTNGYIYGDSAVLGQKSGLIYGVKLNGTEKIGYSYDDLVRLKTRTLNTSTPFVTEYGYLAGAKVGTTTTLIKTVKNGNDTLEYAYDVFGNITSIKKNGTVVESYTYDSLSQLKTVTRGSDVWEYTYDNGGNILSVTKNGIEIKTYGYDDTNWKDKMTSFNGQTITYDAIGNPLQYRDGYNFTWANVRYLSTITNGANAYSYTYDADGIRTTKTVNGTTTTYYWANGVLQAQKTGSEYIVFLYDENGTAYGMLLKNGTIEEYYYYIYNAQGDVIGIIDSNGTKVVEYTYGAWGEILNVTGTLADTIGQKNPLRYRGYYYDEET